MSGADPYDRKVLLRMFLGFQHDTQSAHCVISGLCYDAINVGGQAMMMTNKIKDVHYGIKASGQPLRYPVCIILINSMFSLFNYAFVNDKQFSYNFFFTKKKYSLITHRKTNCLSNLNDNKKIVSSM